MWLERKPLDASKRKSDKHNKHSSATTPDRSVSCMVCAPEYLERLALLPASQIDGSYTDIQLEMVLEHECNLIRAIVHRIHPTSKSYAASPSCDGECGFVFLLEMQECFKKTSGFVWELDCHYPGRECIDM